MNKQHVTKGPVHIGVRQPNSDKFIYGVDGTEIANCDRLTNFPDENQANAELIAEAFNVLHETGMTPRELADTLIYLEGKLGSLCDTMPDQDWADTDATAVDSDLSRCRHIIDDMQAKLEEHQPVTPA